jgi:Mrp family chromosome partitioning ATPase
LGEITEALRRERIEGAEPQGAARLETPPRRREEPPTVAISRLKHGAWAARAVWVEQSGPVAEAFRHLALRVRSELERRGTSNLLVTSALPEDGKTLVACNLALALASISTRDRIALMDLDLRRPSVARSLGARCRVGIERVLEEKADLDSAIVRTDIPALDLVLAGHRIREPHRCAADPRIGQILQQLARHYTVVICDTPPALPFPDVGLLSRHFGASLLVARAGKTLRSAYAKTSALLPRNQIIGTFRNCARPPRHERRYYRGYEYAPNEDDVTGDERE